VPAVYHISIHDQRRHDSGCYDQKRHDSGRYDPRRHDSDRHDQGAFVTKAHPTWKPAGLTVAPELIERPENVTLFCVDTDGRTCAPPSEREYTPASSSQ